MHSGEDIKTNLMVTSVKNLRCGHCGLRCLWGEPTHVTVPGFVEGYEDRPGCRAQFVRVKSWFLSEESLQEAYPDAHCMTIERNLMI